MQSYEASRKLLGFAEACSWLAFSGGVIILFFALKAISAGSIVTAISLFASGGGMALLALVGIVVTQMSRAGIDTAEYTGQLLKVARDQLEVSKEAVRGESAPKGFSGLTKGEPVKTEPSARIEPRMQTRSMGDETKFIEYRGKQIKLSKGRYSFEGVPLNDLAHAKEYLDKYVIDFKK